jgi:hypothetical protein
MACVSFPLSFHLQLEIAYLQNCPHGQSVVIDVVDNAGNQPDDKIPNMH